MVYHKAQFYLNVSQLYGPTPDHPNTHPAIRRCFNYIHFHSKSQTATLLKQKYINTLDQWFNTKKKKTESVHTPHRNPMQGTKNTTFNTYRPEHHESFT